MATYDTQKYAQIIKSDVTLNDNADVYSTAFEVNRTNGKMLVQVYWNDDADALTENKTLTMGIGNDEGNAKLNGSGNIFSVLTGASGNTSIAKGDLLGEYILPPSVEDEGEITVWLRSDSTTSGLTGKNVQVQISAIV